MHTCVCNTPIRSHMYTLAQACKEHMPEHTQTCTHRPMNPLTHEQEHACAHTHTRAHTSLHTCRHTRAHIYTLPKPCLPSTTEEVKIFYPAHAADTPGPREIGPGGCSEEVAQSWLLCWPHRPAHMHSSVTHAGHSCDPRPGTEAQLISDPWSSVVWDTFWRVRVCHLCSWVTPGLWGWQTPLGKGASRTWEPLGPARSSAVPGTWTCIGFSLAAGL